MNYIDIEKSIATIKEILNCEDYVEVVFPVLTKALKTSLQALEKQSPKKRGCFIGFVKEVYYFCPTCEYVRIKDKQKHCHECGQKLDWEAVEDE